MRSTASRTPHVANVTDALKLFAHSLFASGSPTATPAGTSAAAPPTNFTAPPGPTNATARPGPVNVTATLGSTARPTAPIATTPPTAFPVPTAPVAAPTANVSDASPAVGIDATRGEPVRTEVATPNVTELTSPSDGYVYDFDVSDEDYIAPLAPLPYVNLTRIRDLAPPIPAIVAAVQLPVADGLVSWDQKTLLNNKKLWNRGNPANCKIEDAVAMLQEAADLYMETPLFAVSNKTSLLPAQEPHMAPNARMYFSLSEYYWPNRVSSVNPNGLPYAYSPTINPEVRACGGNSALPSSFCAFLDPAHLIQSLLPRSIAMRSLIARLHMAAASARRALLIACWQRDVCSSANL